MIQIARETEKAETSEQEFDRLGSANDQGDGHYLNYNDE